MTTVAQLRTPVSRRNRTMPDTKANEFRDDVLAYGSALYEALKQRRDFSEAKEHDSRKKAKADA